MSGRGCIDGRDVDCIAPEWMFQFRTAYSPAAKDLEDVMRLARRFGFVVPPTARAPALS